jgi:hypothetical protein
MRVALLHAYTNQLVLLQLVSRKNMLKLSQQWSAEDELDKLEDQLLSQRNSSMLVDQESAIRPSSTNPPHLMEASSGHMMKPLRQLYGANHQLLSSGSPIKRASSAEPPSYYFTPAGKLAAICTLNGQPLHTCYTEREYPIHSPSPLGLPVQHPPHSGRAPTAYGSQPLS